MRLPTTRNSPNLLQDKDSRKLQIVLSSKISRNFTFMLVLYYPQEGPLVIPGSLYFVSNLQQRGISLLTEIPATRTCALAAIAPHWCACLNWTEMDVGDKVVKKAARTLLATINSQTRPHRDKCETLLLDYIINAVR